MKTKYLPSIFRLGRAALLASCAFLVAHSQASATTIGVDLGAAGFQTGVTIPPAQFGQAAVFVLGTSGGDVLKMKDGATVFGDVAVEGSGNTKLEKSAAIKGRFAYKTGAKLKISDDAVINGPISSNGATDSALHAGATAALHASAVASGFTATSGLSELDLKSNFTLSIGIGARAVYNLCDFKLDKDVTLTLDGSAGSAFVFNVSKKFELKDNASILLTGGMTWDHVLFNVIDEKNVELKKNSVLTGILLAANGSVKLKDSAKVVGGVIADKVELSEKASITRPPTISPF